jgi:hypothetical protein
MVAVSGGFGLKDAEARTIRRYQDSADYGSEIEPEP